MLERGFGTVGSLPIESIAEMANSGEEYGYDSFWVNIVPGETDPIRTLEAVVDATQRMEIGVGLIPVDAYDPVALAQSLKTKDWPWDRLILGVGAGFIQKGALAAVESAIDALHVGVPSLRVGVGGYGPKILQTAGRASDALCLAWMTPERLVWALKEAGTGATLAGRSLPTTYVYIRTAIGNSASQRIEAEMAIYGRQAHHVRHQASMRAGTVVGIALDHQADLEEALANYRISGSIPIVRGLPNAADDTEEWLNLLALFAPDPNVGPSVNARSRRGSQ